MMAKNVLTQNLSEPLGSATTAKINIDNGDGNMLLDGLTGGEPVLASGTLEYLEKLGQPTRTLDTNDGQANLTLKASGGRQTWFRFPWQACNGATTWNVHLNPKVQSDITAHSGGGNVKIDLAGMAITRLAADTGGGNMDVVLPDNAAGIDVTAKSGGGNVTVEIGGGTTGSNSINVASARALAAWAKFIPALVEAPKVNAGLLRVAPTSAWRYAPSAPSTVTRSTRS